MNETTGVVQRSISSTADGTRVGGGGQAGPLAGMLGEGHQAPGEEVPRRFVPGHQELDEEHGQFGLAQLVAVDLGPGQLAQDVSAGTGPALDGQVDEEGDHLALQPVAPLLGPVGGPGDDGLGPLVEALPVLHRQAHDLADDLEGQGHRQLRHHVDGPVRLEALDQGPGPGPDGGLEGPDHRRLEARLHQPPVAGVDRRVGVHHGGRRLVGGADLVDQDAPAGAEGLVVETDGTHVGV